MDVLYRNLHTEPVPEEEPLQGFHPDYRAQKLRILKLKLRQRGFHESKDQERKLLTDKAFYREFMVKMECLKEIQEEEDRASRR